MDLKEIRSLVSLVEKANVTSFTIEEDNLKIEIKKEAPESTIYNQSFIQEPAHVAPFHVADHAAPVPAPKLSSEASSAKVEAAKDELDDDLTYINSPMVGTFYSSPSPEAPVFTNVGDSISKGSVVCIVEAMKLFNEIESEVSGTVEKILVKNGDPVEYGQPLFGIRV